MVHDQQQETLDDIARTTRKMLCRDADAPPVWTDAEQRAAAKRIAEEVEAAIPGPLCAVCARRRPPRQVSFTAACCRMGVDASCS